MQNSYYGHRNFDNPAFIVFSCHVMENTIKNPLARITVNNYELLEGAEQYILICRTWGGGGDQLFANVITVDFRSLFKARFPSLF